MASGKETVQSLENGHARSRTQVVVRLSSMCSRSKQLAQGAVKSASSKLSTCAVATP